MEELGRELGFDWKKRWVRCIVYNKPRCLLLGDIFTQNYQFCRCWQ
jgi:hypothetical protein